MEGEPAETIIPLLEEHLRVGKRVRETGRLRVSVTTGTEARLVEETLRSRLVDIERVPIGRTVAEAPPVREEGDTLVIPVLEEVLVVERRLVLREEVRLRLRVEERQHAEPVTLRRQQAVIERLPPMPDAPTPTTTGKAGNMRTITGLFDSRPEAERAVEMLVQQCGIDRDNVQVYAAGSENVTAGTMEPRSEDHHGFLASLRDLFLPDEDRATYAEGVRRGGIMVAAQVPDERLDEAMEAFERSGAVDLDTREQEWRQQGWTGASYDTYGGDAVLGSSSDGTRTGVSATTTGSATAAARPAGASTGSATTGTIAAKTARTGGEEVIPLVEERLRVGKREVASGRVRVRTYVVETPVQEQVTLREEHVEVERRPVDRPLTDADRVDFKDRTIEATETSEEAVIGKEARVREEVVVRKEAGERTQTVSDTVRRTEVEVDDDRKRAAGTTPPRNPER
ncbi:YsnF/AvaK domain-containing protein [Siccirubricoccus sp. G192]|uniref:YsnF/AvaK domain-containing protein n=1 Tax=Siccirubricoccus sp. G192 TaxID=2849651 RepID=UPI001C2CC208|nr:YsnF/AvaK domain-containing protein [Siccirubricoccus sp. G192]MBV1795784.1 YsnF/AvaK domain-containing protein [Siccirubricoccus sp. G192]